MAKQQTSEKEIHEATMKKLCWQMAVRNENKVAGRIRKYREIDGIYGLDQSGLLDGFYEWLEEWGVIKKLEKVSAEGIQRVMVPFFQYVMLYFLKTLFGVKSVASLPRLLFTNQGAMKLAGFNAHQIEEGICNRGSHSRKNKKKTGPICDDTLARNIVKIGMKTIEKMFNETISLLAGKGFFPETISVIMDPTDIRTTSKWQECGTVTRKKRIKNKHGKWEEVQITVWGWKLIAVFHADFKIPLAAKLVKIQESETDYTIELLKKAQKNLGGHCRITKIVIDRGHLDGETLWWMNKNEYKFVIPARSNMDIASDARKLAEKIIEKNGIPKKAGIKKQGTGEYIQTRIETVVTGIGKERKTQKKRTVVVGIKGLTSYDQYGLAEVTKKRHKKGFQSNRINVVVVIEWDGKNYGSKNWVVYLTNMKVYKPLKVFDEYDNRSIIENSLFKEAKQGWFIKHAPQKNERALKIHAFFTLTVFALTNAYRKWSYDKQLDGDEEECSLGVKRWREKKNMRAKDKCLVFTGNNYGIFWMAEVMVLLGVKIKDIPSRAGSRKKILARYGLGPE